MLDAAGKLGGINPRTLENRCVFYEYFLARKPDFMRVSLDSKSPTGRVRDYRAYRDKALRELDNPDSRYFKKVDGKGKVSKDYLKKAIEEAKPDIVHILEQPREEITRTELTQMGRAYSQGRIGRTTPPPLADLVEINKRIEEMQKAIEAGRGATNPVHIKHLKMIK